MKKLLAMVVTMALGMSVLSGCGADTGASASKGELNLYVWTEYIPQSVIDSFEEETGITVNMSTFSSNEDMLAKVKSETAGTYDLVQPSDYMVAHMIAEDMLAEIDKDLLTNYANLDESFLNPSYDPGNVYSIPYQGGLGAIGVNTDKISMEITSYDDLFSPELANTIVALDDYRAVIGMTERSMGLSMNETDAAELEAVAEKLYTIKENIKVYDSDSAKSSLIAGDCNVAYNWSAEVALANEENPAIEIVYPEEGAYKFMDNWAITKDAKNYENAVKFIDYILDAEVGKIILEEFPYVSANKESKALMGDDYLNNEAKNVPGEEWEKGEFVENLDPSVLEIYDAMWTTLKS